MSNEVGLSRPSVGNVPGKSQKFSKAGNGHRNQKPYADILFGELVSKGLIGEADFGSKYCFNVSGLSKEQKEEFGKAIGYITDNTPDTVYKQNWWTFFKPLDEASFAEMEKVVELYKKYPEGRFNVYASVRLPVCFENENILKDDANRASKYPFGVFGFSDSKNYHDVVRGAFAVCTEAAAKTYAEENNEFFKVIGSQKDKIEIELTFKSAARICIVDVASEDPAVSDSESEETSLYPTVTTNEILFSAFRNHSECNRKGFIDKIKLSRVEVANTIVESVPDFIITMAFAKNETKFNSDSVLHNAADFLWAIGEDYTAFNITEDGFASRRVELKLNPEQEYLGEEYRVAKEAKAADKKAPKKFKYKKPHVKSAPATQDEDYATPAPAEEVQDESVPPVEEEIVADDAAPVAEPVPEPAALINNDDSEIEVETDAPAPEGN